MSCSVNIKNLSYEINGRVLFENLNLDISHKEKIAIVGSNGSGKSSLLKIIAGLIKPNKGKVFLFHEEMTSLKEYKKFRNEIGYLPQDVNDFFLCPTVIEDIMFNLRAKGLSKEEVYKKACLMLEQLDILPLQNRNIFDLSGGEQKIVALAAILISEPKILLLDEPTNALDDEAQEKIINILNSINKSMIIVSHHKSFIQSLTPTIYKLNQDNLKRL
ncbi:cobalt ABC transporter ATP-binding protein [Halarcobacter mediterraneus]|uniref:Cobalt ABC transporter ATP-binding protein n=1 Tax=Halarcobacter mediterraneus TaxID=2023153 RepID=A0A4Q1AS04_9BACT|nr:ABC transporter ATP-binding protein [Halarcobacter mediterraneus]RXK11835.1 cobalt ABC transporter ATP-binding protein [Halarcobacter mediterraneus]